MKVINKVTYYLLPAGVHLFNQFLADVSILYPLKTPENQRFSDVSRGYKMGILVRYRLKSTIQASDNYVIFIHMENLIQSNIIISVIFWSVNFAKTKWFQETACDSSKSIPFRKICRPENSRFGWFSLRLIDPSFDTPTVFLL